MKYVIIGGGIAGTTAAEELRRLDEQAEITLIGEEQHPLYSRVLLPHYVKEKVPREKVFMKKPEWYQEKNIEYLEGVRITKIDPKNAFVATDDGREHPFEKLLITTGGDVNLIGQDMRGVSYFRTIDDADQLYKLIQEVKTLPETEQHAAVYGGGFISLEYINMFAHYGIKTDVLMRSGGFWSKILGEESQELLKKHAEANGVTVRTHAAGFELMGETELNGLTLEDGTELPVKIFGIGIGIHVDMSILEQADVHLKHGIVANEFLETNLENVYTAGDVAEFQDTLVDRELMAGNWMSAVMQARTVAKTMAGERTAFELVSSYATNLLGKEIVFIGDTARSEADEIVQHVLDDENSVEIFNRNGRTVGAVMIGAVTERQAITNAIKIKENYVA